VFFMLVFFMVLPVISGEKEPNKLDDFFGINELSPGYSKKEPRIRDKQSEKTGIPESLGTAWQRLSFQRDIIEGETGVFTWEHTDLAVKELSLNNRNIAAVFYYDLALNKGYFPEFEDQAESFVRYVSHVIQRYKKNIKHWELGIKPEIVSMPDPSLYAALLKAVYREAKLQDPDCHILAPSISGTELWFLESLYRENCSTFFDIVSYRHFPNECNEAILQKEIFDLSYLMKRFGDEGKNIWITEMAAPGKENAPNDNDESVWLVKAHIAAMDSGTVEHVFWHTLSGKNSDFEKPGRSTRVFSDTSPKPFPAYQNMARLLKPTQYAGPLFINPEIEGYLFKDGKKQLVVCWSTAEKTVLSLPAKNELTMIDLFGKETKLKPSSGWANFTLSQKPVYILGTDQQIVIFKTVKIEPRLISCYPGQSQDITITLENPYSLNNITARIELKTPRRFILRENDLQFTLGSKQRVSKTIRLITSAERTPGFFELEARGEMHVPHKQNLYCRAPIRVIDPIRISLNGKQDARKLFLETRVENLTTDDLKGIIKWELRPRGKVQISPLAFSSLASNDSLTTYCRLSAGNKEARLFALAELENGYKTEKGIGLMMIPLRLVAPSINGGLREWIDVPKMVIPDSSQSLKGEEAKGVSKKEPSGIFQFWMTENALYVAAIIHDDNPLMNPFHKQGICRGDGFDLFLGLSGTSKNHQFGDMDYRITLSPGHKGRLPEMWNWQTNSSIPDGKIVSCRTKAGYIVEAMIPFTEFQNWVPQRFFMIGFNLALNDLDNEERDSPFRQLMWSDSQASKADPNSWGFAVIR